MRWFANLSQRERTLVGVMALLAVGVGFYRFVWQPVDTARIAAKAEIAALEQITAEVREAGPSLRNEPEPVRRNPATVVTETAAAFDLPIRRLEPENGVTRVVFSEVGFDALIGWLGSLETDHALRVTAIEMDRRPEPGVVIARITLEN